MERHDREDVEDGSLAPRHRHHLIFRRNQGRVSHQHHKYYSPRSPFFLPGRGWCGLKKKREAIL